MIGRKMWVLVWAGRCGKYRWRRPLWNQLRRHASRYNASKALPNGSGDLVVEEVARSLIGVCGGYGYEEVRP
jgi:hypothetical protein